MLLGTVAAFDGHKLLALHVTGSSGSVWFEVTCKPVESGVGPDCAAVVASPHSYVPPKRADQAPGTPHVPVAFLGLACFAALGVWLAGVGRPSYQSAGFIYCRWPGYCAA